MKKKERRPIWQYSDEVQDRGEMFVAVMNITERHARMATARLQSKIEEFIILTACCWKMEHPDTGV